MQRVLHGAQRGLGVVGAVQVVAGAELQDDAVLFAWCRLSGDVEADDGAGIGDQRAVGAGIVADLEAASTTVTVPRP